MLFQLMRRPWQFVESLKQNQPVSTSAPLFFCDRSYLMKKNVLLMLLLAFGYPAMTQASDYISHSNIHYY